MTDRVTLNGIRRVGWSNWKARERWFDWSVRVWSAEHRAWWRQNRCGYTDKLEDAGIYKFGDAHLMTRHCGPEKRIEFHRVGETQVKPKKDSIPDGWMEDGSWKP